MERAVDSICYSDPAHLEKPKGAVKPKKDDVQFLVSFVLTPCWISCLFFTFDFLLRDAEEHET